MLMTRCYNITDDQIIKFMPHTNTKKNRRGEWQWLCTNPINLVQYGPLSAHTQTFGTCTPTFILSRVLQIWVQAKEKCTNTSYLNLTAVSRDVNEERQPQTAKRYTKMLQNGIRKCCKTWCIVSRNNFISKVSTAVQSTHAKKI